MLSSWFRTSLNRVRGRRILTDDLERTEQVFQAPPFTPEIATAVSLISTRLSFHPDEESRLLFQAEANAVCQREYTAIAPLFEKLPRPNRILEIGPGFGRSAVYFEKRNVWASGRVLHLYDADGTQTKYKQKHYERPPQWPDVSSFCGNLSLLRRFLEYNEIGPYELVDGAKLPIRGLPGPYDLIYSFFSVGFHWSLEFYLEDLDPLLAQGGVLICTLNKHFRPFEKLGDFSTRVLKCPDIKKNAAPFRLLALSKSRLPSVGLPLTEALGNGKL